MLGYVSFIFFSGFIFFEFVVFGCLGSCGKDCCFFGGGGCGGWGGWDVCKEGVIIFEDLRECI